VAALGDPDVLRLLHPTYQVRFSVQSATLKYAIGTVRITYAPITRCACMPGGDGAVIKELRESTATLNMKMPNRVGLCYLRYSYSYRVSVLVYSYSYETMIHFSTGEEAAKEHLFCFDLKKQERFAHRTPHCGVGTSTAHTHKPRQKSPLYY
jgi:hypothetical protein